jgi:hypothetical protein
MALLNNEIVQQVQQRLADLPDAVKLMVFTSPEHCDYCKEIVQLAEESPPTSENSRWKSTTFNKRRKSPSPEHHHGPSDCDGRRKGLWAALLRHPVRHEFSTLLAGIERASYGKPDLDEQTKTYLAS